MEKHPLILAVDDEEPIRKLLRVNFTVDGYDVITASNGISALELMEEYKPDLVILDIMMPKMDGYAIAERLRRQDETRVIPIIMVTALREADDRVKAWELGADGFLSKPVELRELLTRVNSLLKVKDYNDHLRDHQRELEAELAKRTEELQQAFRKTKTASLETIHRLSRAAEYRDEDTGTHIQRVIHYAAAIARQMGLDDESVKSILYAAPMHDVGKIGIPDRILRKPEKLDPDEWETMKKHTIIGAEILSGSDADFIELAGVIALTHHEKWDGSGYPDGLKGTDIPLAGRITAIADVFDALTSKRPYKDPFSVEEALSIIEEGRGSHFGPKIVDAFFTIEDEILSVKDNYKGRGESAGSDGQMGILSIASSARPLG